MRAPAHKESIKIPAPCAVYDGGPRLQAATASIGVHVFNHRSVAQILAFLRSLGGMIGAAAKAEALAAALTDGLRQLQAVIVAWSRKSV